MKHRVLNVGGVFLVLISFFVLATVTAETSDKRERIRGAIRNGVNSEQPVADDKERQGSLVPRQAVKNLGNSLNAQRIQNSSRGERNERSRYPGRTQSMPRRLNPAEEQKINRADVAISGSVQRGQMSEPRRQDARVENKSDGQATWTDRNRRLAQADRRTRSSNRDAGNQRPRVDTDRSWGNRRNDADYDRNDRRVNDDRDWRNRRDNWRRYTRNDYRRPQVVRRHWFNWYVPLTYSGLRYYYNDGAYYRFNGFSFNLVSGNIGAYIYSLPYGYRSVMIDNYPYYYANNVYYVRDHVRNVYLRVDDPYDTANVRYEQAEQSGYQELFVYPNEGQTEEELGQDKYECHLWAVDKTGFDPGLGKPGDFNEYQRAQCACLEGRGYTVK